MPDYTAFFLNGRSSVVELETIQIWHPSFSKLYRIVRNNTLGLTATLETGETVTFDYYPLRITRPGEQDDLDQNFSISLGDLGEIIPDEIDRVIAAGTAHIKPELIYRTFRSDDLSAPLQGPFKLEITEVPHTAEGAAFDAKPPSIDNSRTGAIYSLARFPMLRGLL